MKVGDRVTWQGYSFEYHGVIVGVVPANMDPLLVLDKSGHPFYFGNWAYPTSGLRRYESYIVEEDGKLHWPKFVVQEPQA